ncbi:MAG: AraC family transcriptional regulator [Phycisphaeraceae bacterium]
MEPLLEHLTITPQSSFRLYTRVDEEFAFEWHHHPEYELTLIVEGHGRRFAGDAITGYQPGDLVLLGPYLPHTWHSDETSRDNTAIVIHFTPEWLKAATASWPEMQVLHRMLRSATHGLSFQGDHAEQASGFLRRISSRSGLSRLALLLEVLQELSADASARPIASPGYRTSSRPIDPRIDRICRHVNDHIHEDLTQSDMALMIRMKPTSFSRLFKRAMGKTFIEYIHELRIANACRALIESDDPITDVCFRAGFNNVSNFNRVFRRVVGVSPRTYRRQFHNPAEQ